MRSAKVFVGILVALIFSGISSDVFADVKSAAKARDEAFIRYRKEAKKYPPTTPQNKAKRKELYRTIVLPAKREYSRAATSAWKSSGSKGVTGADVGMKTNLDGGKGDGSEAPSADAGPGGKAVRNSGLNPSGIKEEIHFKKKIKKKK